MKNKITLQEEIYTDNIQRSWLETGILITIALILIASFFLLSAYNDNHRQEFIELKSMNQ